MHPTTRPLGYTCSAAQNPIIQGAPNQPWESWERWLSDQQRDLVQWRRILLTVDGGCRGNKAASAWVILVSEGPGEWTIYKAGEVYHDMDMWRSRSKLD